MCTVTKASDRGFSYTFFVLTSLEGAPKASAAPPRPLTQQLFFANCFQAKYGIVLWNPIKQE